ncbi:hypothetical protein A2154_02255 [Candidatus Gottesmanbacteria bacterium RBG_16_43_7]|uniref:RNA polymerase sigma factor n=1 Tax=Candidatus Gottesmanbacteria bacterium RBG_16_43_7 TaxID=1798373 RepID=A0A1F5ZAK1_9BACT|nr:MAG: hypothetical protein A2154_02255 [Candidatus Gottesmanbacteria bacterium RBG_16_43_7]
MFGIVSFMDDSVLASQILSGNRRALYLFYRTYKPQLHRYISRRVGNSADGEEILQDSLFSFLEALRDFQGKASLKTYLYAICQRKIADYWRRRKVRHVVFSETLHLDALISPLLTPEELYDEKALRTKIARTMDSILPRHRQLLFLKYIEDATTRQIATRLSVTVKTIESALFRARKAFAKVFVKS